MQYDEGSPNKLFTGPLEGLSRKDGWSFLRPSYFLRIAAACFCGSLRFYRMALCYVFN